VKYGSVMSRNYRGVLYRSLENDCIIVEGIV